MAKILLRSGCLDDFQATGDNGQTVFDSALQIRETLRLRQQFIGEYLAIPQRNDEGDHVDWYAPQAGKVISWLAASDAQRLSALNALETALQSASMLCQQCQQSGKTAVQLFGRLLEKALQFPGVNYVYLVNNQPVITFWGFVTINQLPGDNNDALACLRQTLKSNETSSTSPAARPAALSGCNEYNEIAAAPDPDTALPWPAVTESAAPASASSTATPPLNPKLTRRFSLWLLPIAAMFVAVIVGIVLQQQRKSPAPVTAPVVSIESIKTTPLLIATLPLAPAQLSVPVSESAEVTPAATVQPAFPVKNELMMNADQVRDGKTHFLDGRWQITPTANVTRQQFPQNLYYKIQHNAGTASLQLSAQITCQGKIYSGLHQSGILMIKPRGRAHCSNGHYYILPEIACKTGDNDIARCHAHFRDETQASVLITKMSD